MPVFLSKRHVKLYEKEQIAIFICLLVSCTGFLDYRVQDWSPVEHGAETHQEF